MRFTLIVVWYVWWDISANCMERIPLETRNKRKLNVYKDEWMVQKLDHFNPSDKRTWKQRYQVNSDYHEKDGPVFLLIAGESEINYNDLINERLTWIQYAKEFKALCLQLEHRFYGKSIPINVVSVESFKYLSINQALADVGEFAAFIQSKYSFQYKLIVFGGSYPASLAIWARMQYPNHIHGAMVSSPTINLQVENHESVDLLKEVLFTENPDCVLQIKNAVQDLNAHFTTSWGSEIIKEKFKLCQSPNMFNELEQKQLFLALRKSLTYAVKFNNSSTFNIKHVCDIMVNNSTGEPISRLKEITIQYLKREKLSCLENSKYIEETYTKRLTLWDNFTIQNDDNYKEVEKSLSSYSSNCVAKIKEAEHVIKFAFKSKRGANIITNIFKLCKDPNRTSKKSRQFFFHDLMINFYKAAQYNRIFSFNPSYVCGLMTDTSLGKPLDRLAKLFQTRIKDLVCYNYDYDFRIEYLKPRANQVLRATQIWQFQVCSEFGNFAVSNRRVDLFAENIPLNFYEDVCIDLFGRLYTAKELTKRQEQIKKLYIKSTDNRIVVVQGSSDVASYQKNITKYYEGYFNMIVMKGMAHSIDWSIRDGDREITRANREKIRILMRWLGISYRMLPRDELK